MLVKSLGILLLCFFNLAFASTQNEQKTTLYLQHIRNDPSQVRIFIDKMPKGGDIHMHLLGETYAENLIAYAKHDDLCLNSKTYDVIPCNKKNLNPVPFSKIINDKIAYSHLIDAWSLRNFAPSAKESAHDHFFHAFKFIPLIDKHQADILAELVRRARDEHVSYLEVMVFTDCDKILALSKDISWNNNLNALKNTLMQKGIKKVVDHIYKHVLIDETKAEHKLKCYLGDQKDSCQVIVKYQYQACRDMPKKLVFAQLLAGFELANRHPDKFVGINIAGPEDDPTTLKDYKAQMRMIGFLHTLYPHVKISLHAGELTPELVIPENLRFHINEAVNIAHANRIGHGVDIMYEKNPTQLLQQMRKQHILVETNLTSNAKILGIKGGGHPFQLYRAMHVPLALSTDDAGTLRTDMNNEFTRATLTYELTYPELKTLARNSLTYSFLSGKSIWENPGKLILTSSCDHNSPTAKTLNKSCQAFLKHNQKAQLQWLLEKQFDLFEKKIKKIMLDYNSLTISTRSFKQSIM